jgi:deoxyribonuclease V
LKDKQKERNEATSSESNDLRILDRKSPFSVEKAHRTQLDLSKRIILGDRLPRKIRYIAGVDVAYTKTESFGTVAVLNYETLELVESQTVVLKTLFPYIPTLLSFREIPPAVLCIRKLQIQPDVFLVDGQGFAHPYHCGFASHLGLILGKPTIGVAKSRLVGQVDEAEARKNIAFLRHEGKIIGAQVTTKHGTKPIYISVGHMVSLKTSIKTVLRCVKDNRIPEPILAAHGLANVEKRKSNIA